MEAAGDLHWLPPCFCFRFVFVPLVAISTVIFAGYASLRALLERSER